VTSVLVLTDDSVLASGLAQVVNATNDLHLAGQCSNPEALTGTIGRTSPHIVLVDMTIGTPLPLLAEIRKSFPDCRICLWARQVPDELAYQAMTIGVRGILRRTLPVADVLTCLRKLSRDEVWFEERLMAGFFSKRPVRLTRRESQLVTLLAQGMKNKEIAYALTLSEGTVKVYLSRLFEKLSVKDRFELALYGLRHLSADSAHAQLPALGMPTQAHFPVMPVAALPVGGGVH
jgi:DNA-binding NarL/FixJ family response regulator